MTDERCESVYCTGSNARGRDTVRCEKTAGHGLTISTSESHKKRTHTFMYTSAVLERWTDSQADQVRQVPAKRVKSSFPTPPPAFKWNFDEAGAKFSLDMQKIIDEAVQKMLEVEAAGELHAVVEILRSKGYTVIAPDEKKATNPVITMAGTFLARREGWELILRWDGQYIPLIRPGSYGTFENETFTFGPTRLVDGEIRLPISPKRGF